MLSARRRQSKCWVSCCCCVPLADNVAGSAPHTALACMQACPRLPCPALPHPPPAGSFWGTTFRPGDVLDLEVDQMEALLAATSGNLLSGGSSSSSSSGGTAASAGASKVLDDALFAHAESVSNRFFGRDVYYRGIVEFSNVRAGQMQGRG